MTDDLATEKPDEEIVPDETEPLPEGIEDVKTDPVKEEAPSE